MNTLLHEPTRLKKTLIMSIALAASSVAPTLACASPDLLRYTKSVQIDAPVAKVWETVGSFSDLTWVPAVKKSTATADNEPGSRRTLDLGGAEMTETLVKYDDAHRTYTYKIDDTASNHKIAPVSDVTSTIVVKKTRGGSLLTWSATFHRLDHGDAPAAGSDDGAAKKQIATVFGIGVAGAKAKIEGP